MIYSNPAQWAEEVRQRDGLGFDCNVDGCHISASVLLRSGEGRGTPLQYSCLENPMDGGAWRAAVHGVAKGRGWLSDFTFAFHFYALEKENGNPLQCSCLENPRDSGSPSMGSHRVGHDWSDLAAVAAVAMRRLYHFKYYWLKFFLIIEKTNSVSLFS